MYTVTFLIFNMIMVTVEEEEGQQITERTRLMVFPEQHLIASVCTSMMEQVDPTVHFYT